MGTKMVYPTKIRTYPHKVGLSLATAHNLPMLVYTVIVGTIY